MCYLCCMFITLSSMTPIKRTNKHGKLTRTKPHYPPAHAFLCSLAFFQLITTMWSYCQVEQKSCSQESLFPRKEGIVLFLYFFFKDMLFPYTTLVLQMRKQRTWMEPCHIALFQPISANHRTEGRCGGDGGVVVSVIALVCEFGRFVFVRLLSSNIKNRSPESLTPPLIPWNCDFFS